MADDIADGIADDIADDIAAVLSERSFRDD
jgi:hypothetical protein